MTGGPRIELDSRSPEAIDGRHIRAVTFQDVRMEYLAGVPAVAGHEGSGAPVGSGRRALVVGSGRGLLARGLARLGFEVTAVDPSPVATGLAVEADRAAGDGGGTAAARETEDGAESAPATEPPRDAGGSAGGVVYRTAPAEELGLAAGAFELVYCADTFEVTADLERTVAEAARVLAAGGTLVYDTVNRTPLSRLIYLGAFQALPMTRIMPPGRYAAARLRTPAEMTEVLARNGLRSLDVCGFKPKDARRLLTATLARRRGSITDEEIAPIVGFTLTPDGSPLVTYLGHARKAAG